MGAGAHDVTFLCKMGAEGLLPVRTCTMGFGVLEGATNGRKKRVVFDDVSQFLFISKDGAPCEAAPSDEMRRTYAANEHLVREDRARVY